MDIVYPNAVASQKNLKANSLRKLLNGVYTHEESGTAADGAASGGNAPTSKDERRSSRRLSRGEVDSLAFQAGDCVKLDGLTGGADKYNGAVGVIEAWDDEKSRWRV